MDETNLVADAARRQRLDRMLTLSPAEVAAAARLAAEQAAALEALGVPVEQAP